MPSTPAWHSSDSDAIAGFGSGLFSFCDEDDGFPFGSSASDLDYAHFNVVMQNQIVKLSTSDMINNDGGSSNIIKGNESVDADTPQNRSGCYVGDYAHTSDFLLDGESFDVFRSTFEPVCRDEAYLCVDGLLDQVGSSCHIESRSFECQVSGNNLGCQGYAQCPSGSIAIAAKAACNLEYGSVSDDTMQSLQRNHLEVVRRSDNESDGDCWLENYSRQSGAIVMQDIYKPDGSIYFGCREHDQNGGDCHIRGEVHCYSQGAFVDNAMQEATTATVLAP